MTKFAKAEEAVVQPQDTEQTEDVSPHDMSYEELISGGEGTSEDAAATSAEEPQEQTENPKEAEVEAQQPPQDDRVSKAMAAVARQEARLREEKKAFEREQRSYQEQLSRLMPAIDALSHQEEDGGLAALEALGVDLSKAALAWQRKQSEPDDGAKKDVVTSEVAALKREIEAIRKDRENERLTSRAESYFSALDTVVSGDQFEAVRDYYEITGGNMRHDAAEIFGHFLREEGRSLTPAELADTMKLGATEQLKQMRLKPAWARLHGQPGASQSPQSASKQPAVKAVPPSSPDVKTEDELTPEERIEAIKREFGLS